MAFESARRPNASPEPARADGLRRLRRFLRPLRSADINPAKHGPARRFSLLLGSIWDLGAYVHVLVAVLTAASRKFSGDAPVFLHMLHAVFPFLVVSSAVVLFISLVRRRAILVLLGGGVAISGWFSVAPARKTLPRPTWVQGAAELSLTSSNVYFENSEASDAARTLVARNADVVVVTELTEPFLRILDDQGFSTKYPHRSTVMASVSNGAGVFSKLPLHETRRWGTDKFPDVDVELPNGQLVRVLSIHPLPPLDDRRSKAWNRDLTRLKLRAKDEREIAFAAVGDFNGTRWQPRFGGLLKEFNDAHEAVGKGLSMSWPVTGRFPRFTRLDHALFNDRLYPVSVVDFDVPGSDHRAFEVRFAVQPETEKVRPEGAAEESDGNDDRTLIGRARRNGGHRLLT